MSNLNEGSKNFLSFKIIQSGDVKRISLNPENLGISFQDLFHLLLKELNLKYKDVFLSNMKGKMIGINDLSLSLGEIIQKFGNELRLYSEKIF